MKPYILICVALMMLGLTACDKKGKGTFTVKGRLVEDCSGKPIWGRRISAREHINFGHGAEEIGATTTDSNGYFEFVCGYYSSSPKEVNGLPGTYETPTNLKKGEVIDLGIVYSKFSTRVILKINVLSSSYSFDTLFVKDVYTLEKIDTIYPIPMGEHYYEYSYNEEVSWGGPIRNENNIDSKITYSVGVEDINKYKKTIPYLINFCGLSKDTVTITLP